MTLADEVNKKRVIVDRERKEFRLMTGSWNQNLVVYTGSLVNCIKLKSAFLATGEYIDESEKEFRE